MTGLYKALLDPALQDYILFMLPINTATNFDDYEKPIKRVIATLEHLKLTLSQEFYLTVQFQEIVTRTYTGLLKRTMVEDRKMQVLRTIHKSRKRSPTGKLATINFEVVEDILLVERIYPNLINLLSDIGGLVKSLAVICVTIGIRHNMMRFNEHLLNSLFASEQS